MRREKPWVRGVDVARVARIYTSLFAAALVPPRADPWIVASIRQLWRVSKVSTRARLAARIADRGGLPRAESRALARDWLDRRAEIVWGAIRDAGKRPSRRLDVELVGEEHLRGSAGGGTIVWFQSFCSSRILMAALCRAGCATTHLSSEDHAGLGGSRLGALAAAPMILRAENRYLARRVVMGSRSVPGYLRELEQSLVIGGVVTIRGDLPMPGARYNTTVFDRPARIPRGAPALARRSGSTLVTSHASRVAPCRYRVVIEEALPVEQASPRAADRGAIDEFVRRLEHNVSRCSVDWEGWWWIDRLVGEAEGEV